MDKQVAHSVRTRNAVSQISVLAPCLYNVCTQRSFRIRRPRVTHTLTTSLWRSRFPRLGKRNSFHHTISLLLTLAWLIRNLDFQWRRRRHVCSFHLQNNSANYQLNAKLQPNVTVKFEWHLSYLGISLSVVKDTLIHTHDESLLTSGTHQAAGQCRVGNFFQTTKNILPNPCIRSDRILCSSAHTKHIDALSNESIRVITGYLRNTSTFFLPILSGITPPETSRSASCFKLYNKAPYPKHLLHETLYLKPVSLLRSASAQLHSTTRHFVQFCLILVYPQHF